MFRSDLTRHGSPCTLTDGPRDEDGAGALERRDEPLVVAEAG